MTDIYNQLAKMLAGLKEGVNNHIEHVDSEHLIKAGVLNEDEVVGIQTTSTMSYKLGCKETLEVAEAYINQLARDLQNVGMPCLIADHVNCQLIHSFTFKQSLNNVFESYGLSPILTDGAPVDMVFHGGLEIMRDIPESIKNIQDTLRRELFDLMDNVEKSKYEHYEETGHMNWSLPEATPMPADKNSESITFRVKCLDCEEGQ